MFPNEIMNYLDKVRIQRAPTIASADDYEVFPILGYHPEIALIPSSLLDRGLTEEETALTYLMHELFNDTHDYRVVIAGSATTVIPVIHRQIEQARKALNIDLIAGYMFVLHSTITTASSPDHYQTHKLRDDVFDMMDLYQVRECISLPIAVYLASLINDVVYVQGLENEAKANRLEPSDVEVVRLERKEQRALCGLE